MVRRSYGSGVESKTSYQGSGAIHYGSANTHYGSIAIRGSGTIHGSAAKQGSGGTYSSPNHGAFSPTIMPTEALPPVIQAPRPTFTPSKSINIPKIKINHAVPNIPITFHVKHGASGWATFPDDPTLTEAFENAVSRATDNSNAQINNLRIMNTAVARRLITELWFAYNITAYSPETPLQTYDTMTQSLRTSVKTHQFSMYLHESGLPVNITSIEISPYIIVETKAVQPGSLEINLVALYVSLGSIMVFISIMYYFVNKHSNIKNETIDTIPNPIVAKNRS